jgi:hypothetical protein
LEEREQIDSVEVLEAQQHVKNRFVLIDADLKQVESGQDHEVRQNILEFVFSADLAHEIQDACMHLLRVNHVVSDKSFEFSPLIISGVLVLEKLVVNLFANILVQKIALDQVSRVIYGCFIFNSSRNLQSAVLLSFKFSACS